MFPWQLPVGMLPLAGQERGNHASWAGQLGTRCWFLGRLSHDLQCAAQHPACLTEIRTLQRRGQKAARPGTPQGSTWKAQLAAAQTPLTHSQALK